MIFFLLFGIHLYFTLRLGVIQRKIPLGIRLSVNRKTEGIKQQEKGISSYSALATALAATIGTGNIIGISTAIAIGGPGAVFWCWITGVLGIATCYAECFLAVRYKVREKDGCTYGGPMYVLERGLGQKGLAILFAVFTVLASFGIGSSVQAYSIRTAVSQMVRVSPHIVGIVTGALVGLVIIGGSRQIATVCTWLVPLMSALYLGGCIFIILRNITVIPKTLYFILESAFCGKAVIGGMSGGTVMLGIRTGISRGLFTNEAGLGSIPITAASTRTNDAVRQGLVSMTGPFWDTVVMCAITGIALISSMIKQPQNYVQVAADKLCFVAFAELPAYGEMLLAVSLILFAFATTIGWNVYGVSAVRYLWGEQRIKIYQVFYMLSVYLGAVLSMKMVWGLSDVFNIFMAVPNLIGLFLLQNEVIDETKSRVNPVENGIIWQKRK